MADQEKDIKGIIENSANNQSNAPTVKEELIGRHDRKKTISLIRYVLQKMEDKKTPYVPLHYTLIALYNSLELLSDQEPRVMALEEVRRCGYHVFIELKDKNGAETIGSTDPEDLKEFKSLYSAFWHLHWRRGNVMLEEFYLGIPSNRDYKETDKYNATWRCWDKLPPDQLMEATPWGS